MRTWLQSINIEAGKRDGWVGLIVAERDRDSKIGHVRVRSGWITLSTEKEEVEESGGNTVIL